MITPGPNCETSITKIAPMERRRGRTTALRASWRPLAFAAIAAAWGGGCRNDPGPPAAAAGEIRALLDRQARDWNAGDLAGYMDGYERSAGLRFHSGGDVTLGWQTVHDRYRNRYQDRAAMGRLTFSDVAVEALGPRDAVAHGRWHLQRAQDAPSGLFTLLLRKHPEGWRIRYDHTSSR
jgi:hypothetical protein